MKKCKKCGTELRDGAEFCSECGAKVKAKKWVPWTIGSVVVVLLGGGIWFFSQNDDAKDTTKGEPKQETVASKEEESLEKKLIENPTFLAAAVSWYGSTTQNNEGWDNWKLKTTVVEQWKMDPRCQNTEKGDGYYYAFKAKEERNNFSGYVISKDKHTIYLYSRYSVAEGVPEKPFATITIADLAKKIEEEGKTSEIEKQTKEIKVSSEKKEEKKEEKDPVLELGDKQVELHDYMEKWQKAMGQEYTEAPVDPDEDGIIEMKDVTITNHLDGKEDALLSIEGKFVDVSIVKPSKQGYQVIAAYSGVSENAKKYRYLFVLHDNKPEVLVATLPAAIGETKKGPAINFVPTKNEALPSAFAEIVKTGKAPAAPKKAKNVVNSLEDAKEIYKKALNRDCEEGTEPYPDAPGMGKNGEPILGEMSSKWKENSDGTYTYFYSVNNGGAIRGHTTIYPDGSVERFTAHSGQFIGGKCTYQDVEEGTAEEKLMSLRDTELVDAGING